MKSDTDSQEKQRTVISRSTVDFMASSPPPPPKKKRSFKTKFLPEIDVYLPAFLDMPYAHVRHVNTSYGRFPLVQSLNIFILVSGNPQQNTSAFGGNGKSGWNEQEQCIV